MGNKDKQKEREKIHTPNSFYFLFKMNFICQENTQFKNFIILTEFKNVCYDQTQKSIVFRSPLYFVFCSLITVKVYLSNKNTFSQILFNCKKHHCLDISREAKSYQTNHQKILIRKNTSVGKHKKGENNLTSGCLNTSRKEKQKMWYQPQCVILHIKQDLYILARHKKKTVVISLFEKKKFYKTFPRAR